MKTRVLVAGAFVTLLACPGLADDITVQLGAGDGFVVEDDGGTVERLRVDEATGNVWRNGDLFMHTTGSSNTFVGPDTGSTSVTGSYNTAFGDAALSSVTTGAYNAAFGPEALHSNTTGSDNSAFGDVALFYNSTGSDNSAFGDAALVSNTGGNSNSAFGALALVSNTTGLSNSAFGVNALHDNSTGHRNVAVGDGAGMAQTTGNDNIYIGNAGAAGESGQIRIGTGGTHTDTFIAGIDGNTVAGSPVLVTASGELGVAVSSRRFKQAVRDMGEASEVVMQLRPVTFEYREEVSGAGDQRQYGLLAEEVAEVAPGLVTLDADGRPYSVRYHVLPSLLLNELQKQRRVIAEQRSALAEQGRRTRMQMAALMARLDSLESRLAGDAEGPPSQQCGAAEPPGFD